MLEKIPPPRPVGVVRRPPVIVRLSSVNSALLVKANTRRALSFSTVESLARLAKTSVTNVPGTSVSLLSVSAVITTSVAELASIVNPSRTINMPSEPNRITLFSPPLKTVLSNVIVSSPERSLVISIASRKLPTPESLLFVTIKVASNWRVSKES